MTQTPSRVLYVAGCGSKYDTEVSLLESIFGEYGAIDEILMPEGFRYVYIVFSESSSAVRAMGALSNKNVPGLSSSLYIRWALEELPRKDPPEPDCISTTSDVVVPGCIVVEEFLSEEEEAEWQRGVLGELDPEQWEQAPWAQILSRRVQHYGFPFNYHTLLLDYGAVTPPVPRHCALALQRAAAFLDNPHMPITQMTVNEYEKGQGIAGHVDSKACFGPAVIIISCAAGITMTLQKRVEPSKSCPLPKGSRKHLWLSPRSLLILQREARFDWSHAIATRFRDQVDGRMVERGKRLSFTFRQALALGEAPKGALSESELEKEHVFRVYDHIAQHWHHTRGRRKVHWGRVKEFLESLAPGSLLADVGSGDGKYLDLAENVFAIGGDRSLRLLEVSRQPHHELFCSDAVKLPLRDGVFDAAICIAVLHHLASVDRRVAVLKELLRVVRPGGRIMVQAWAMEQEAGSKRTFHEQDVMVPWRLNKKYVDEDVATGGTTGERSSGEGQANDDESGVMKPPQHVVEERGLLTYQRYCHVYKRGELENLCRSVPGCRLIDCGYDRSNWYVELECVEEGRLLESDVSEPMTFPHFIPRTLKS